MKTESILTGIFICFVIYFTSASCYDENNLKYIADDDYEDYYEDYYEDDYEDTESPENYSIIKNHQPGLQGKQDQQDDVSINNSSNVSQNNTSKVNKSLQNISKTVDSDSVPGSGSYKDVGYESTPKQLLTEEISISDDTNDLNDDSTSEKDDTDNNYYEFSTHKSEFNFDNQNILESSHGSSPYPEQKANKSLYEETAVQRESSTELAQNSTYDLDNEYRENDSNGNDAVNYDHETSTHRSDFKFDNKNMLKPSYGSTPYPENNATKSLDEEANVQKESTTELAQNSTYDLDNEYSENDSSNENDAVNSDHEASTHRSDFNFDNQNILESSHGSSPYTEQKATKSLEKEATVQKESTTELAQKSIYDLDNEYSENDSSNENDAVNFDHEASTHRSDFNFDNQNILESSHGSTPYPEQKATKNVYQQTAVEKESTTELAQKSIYDLDNEYSENDSSNENDAVNYDYEAFTHRSDFNFDNQNILESSHGSSPYPKQKATKSLEEDATVQKESTTELAQKSIYDLDNEYSENDSSNENDAVNYDHEAFTYRSDFNFDNQNILESSHGSTPYPEQKATKNLFEETAVEKESTTELAQKSIYDLDNEYSANDSSNENDAINYDHEASTHRSGFYFDNKNILESSHGSSPYPKQKATKSLEEEATVEKESTTELAQKSIYDLDNEYSENNSLHENDAVNYDYEAFTHSSDFNFDNQNILESSHGSSPYPKQKATKSLEEDATVQKESTTELAQKSIYDLDNEYSENDSSNEHDAVNYDHEAFTHRSDINFDNQNILESSHGSSPYPKQKPTKSLEQDATVQKESTTELAQKSIYDLDNEYRENDSSNENDAVNYDHEAFTYRSDFNFDNQNILESSHGIIPYPEQKATKNLYKETAVEKESTTELAQKSIYDLDNEYSANDSSNENDAVNYDHEAFTHRRDFNFDNQNILESSHGSSPYPEQKATKSLEEDATVQKESTTEFAQKSIYDLDNEYSENDSSNENDAVNYDHKASTHRSDFNFDNKNILKSSHGSSPYHKQKATKNSYEETAVEKESTTELAQKSIYDLDNEYSANDSSNENDAVNFDHEASTHRSDFNFDNKNILESSHGSTPYPKQKATESLDEEATVQNESTTELAQNSTYDLDNEYRENDSNGNDAVNYDHEASTHTSDFNFDSQNILESFHGSSPYPEQKATKSLYEETAVQKEFTTELAQNSTYDLDNEYSENDSSNENDAVNYDHEASTHRSDFNFDNINILESSHGSSPYPEQKGTESLDEEATIQNESTTQLAQNSTYDLDNEYRENDSNGNDAVNYDHEASTHTSDFNFDNQNILESFHGSSPYPEQKATESLDEEATVQKESTTELAQKSIYDLDNEYSENDLSNENDGVNYDLEPSTHRSNVDFDVKNAKESSYHSTQYPEQILDNKHIDSDSSDENHADSYEQEYSTHEDDVKFNRKNITEFFYASTKYPYKETENGLNEEETLQYGPTTEEGEQESIYNLENEHSKNNSSNEKDAMNYKHESSKHESDVDFDNKNTMELSHSSTHPVEIVTKSLNEETDVPNESTVELAEQKPIYDLQNKHIKQNSSNENEFSTRVSDVSYGNKSAPGFFHGSIQYPNKKTVIGLNEEATPQDELTTEESEVQSIYDIEKEHSKNNSINEMASIINYDHEGSTHKSDIDFDNKNIRQASHGSTQYTQQNATESLSIETAGQSELTTEDGKNEFIYELANELSKKNSSREYNNDSYNHKSSTHGSEFSFDNTNIMEALHSSTQNPDENHINGSNHETIVQQKSTTLKSEQEFIYELVIELGGENSSDEYDNDKYNPKSSTNGSNVDFVNENILATSHGSTWHRKENRTNDLIHETILKPESIQQVEQESIYDLIIELGENNSSSEYDNDSYSDKISTHGSDVRFGNASTVAFHGSTQHPNGSHMNGLYHKTSLQHESTTREDDRKSIYELVIELGEKNLSNEYDNDNYNPKFSTTGSDIDFDSKNILESYRSSPQHLKENQTNDLIHDTILKHESIYDLIIELGENNSSSEFDNNSFICRCTSIHGSVGFDNANIMDIHSSTQCPDENHINDLNQKTSLQHESTTREGVPKSIYNLVVELSENNSSSEYDDSYNHKSSTHGSFGFDKANTLDIHGGRQHPDDNHINGLNDETILQHESAQQVEQDFIYDLVVELGANNSSSEYDNNNDNHKSSTHGSDIDFDNKNIIEYSNDSTQHSERAGDRLNQKTTVQKESTTQVSEQKSIYDLEKELSENSSPSKYATDNYNHESTYSTHESDFDNKNVTEFSHGSTQYPNENTIHGIKNEFFEQNESATEKSEEKLTYELDNESSKDDTNNYNHKSSTYGNGVGFDIIPVLHKDNTTNAYLNNNTKHLDHSESGLSDGGSQGNTQSDVTNEVIDEKYSANSVPRTKEFESYVTYSNKETTRGSDSDDFLRSEKHNNDDDDDSKDDTRGLHDLIHSFLMFFKRNRPDWFKKWKFPV